MMGRLYSDHVQGTGYTVVKMDAGGKQSEVFDIGAAGSDFRGGHGTKQRGETALISISPSKNSVMVGEP